MYIMDITKSALKGKFDSLIGREAEIRRIIQVLQKRTKNIPLIIGESGVGKTAIVEILAKRIINGDVPQSIKNKKIYSIDMGALIFEAKLRVDFEEKIKSVIKNLSKEGKGRIILFIDNIAGLVKYTRYLGNMLYREKVNCVGATTFFEYIKFLEKDIVLNRMFQKIMVSEPSQEDTIVRLRRLKKRYELHHCVNLTTGAILAAVKLSNRYITNRKLPEKAIDLIDEAASLRRMGRDYYKTEVFDKIEWNLIQLKIEREVIEREVIEREKYNYSKKILSILKNKIKEISKECNSKKDLLNGASAYRIIYGLEKKKENKQDLTEEEIAEVLSIFTGIPIAKILESEIEKLKKMEDVLHKRIIGQIEAVHTVCNSVRRISIPGRKNKNKICSFLFIGPTGVGKTELCKVLSDLIFNTEEIVRIDLSDKNYISRLFFIRPFSVILLYNVDQFNSKILIQILETGIFIDNEGRHVYFRNTIIIIITNLGNEIIKRLAGESYTQLNFVVMELVTAHFNPDFIKIIDDFVIFNSLFINEINSIVSIKIKKLKTRLAKKNIKLELTQDVLEKISSFGFSPVYGASPIKKVIQKILEKPISKAMLYGTFIKGDIIKVVLEKDQFVFRKEILSQNQ
ncbi:Chaperone protein ClpB [Candidatus Portiera aleyrodidarum]|uniref:Chaperone protein ClpB n=2 Tax=Candidatus Portiera aleyrodidarum TaxID=91844 RepID=A0A8D9N7Z7_9GAMM|nr:Chaperone protein ClpB [Candidatus Portiera aleyrodidarum]